MEQDKTCEHPQPAAANEPQTRIEGSQKSRISLNITKL